MIIVLLAAVAMLCGVSVGLVFGLLLGWSAANRATDDQDELDYSGGL